MWLYKVRYRRGSSNNYFPSQRSLPYELSAFVLRLDDVVSIRKGTATNRRRRDRPRNWRLHLQRVVEVDNIITLHNSFVSVCTGSALIYLQMINETSPSIREVESTHSLTIDSSFLWRNCVIGQYAFVLVIPGSEAVLQSLATQTLVWSNPWFLLNVVQKLRWVGCVTRDRE